jgi:hypothetical protein
VGKYSLNFIPQEIIHNNPNAKMFFIAACMPFYIEKSNNTGKSKIERPWIITIERQL